MIDKNEIIRVFEQLNSSNLDYLLLRNINQELPGKLKEGKDIDLLVHKDDLEKWIPFFKTIGFNVIQHPLRNDVFLYETDPFVFLLHKESGLIIDLNFQLCVRSLDKGQWIPLDQEIQLSAFENKIFEETPLGLNYWTLGKEDRFITLITRSIFDKKKVSPGLYPWD
jgi:hypothetical protein